MPLDPNDRIELLKMEIGYYITRYENHKEDAGDRIGWCLWLLVKYGAVSDALKLHQQIMNLILVDA